jgi:hypothetical protein
VANEGGVKFITLDPVNCVVQLKTDSDSETYFLNKVIFDETRQYWTQGKLTTLHYTLIGNPGDNLVCFEDGRGRTCFNYIHKFAAWGDEGRIKILEQAMTRLHPGLCRGTTRQSPQQKIHDEEREKAYEQQKGAQYTKPTILPAAPPTQTTPTEAGRGMKCPDGWAFFWSRYQTLPIFREYLVCIAADGTCEHGYRSLVDGTRIFEILAPDRKTVIGHQLCTLTRTEICRDFDNNVTTFPRRISTDPLPPTPNAQCHG